MQFAQIYAAVQNKHYALLQSHIDTGDGFDDPDGSLLTAAVEADDDKAIHLLLRGGCGLLGGDGLAVICAARLGRGRSLQLFRTHPDWKSLSTTSIETAFSAATEGRRVECMDILVSTHRVSPPLLVEALMLMVFMGSLTEIDVMRDYLALQLTQLEKLRAAPAPNRSFGEIVLRGPGRAVVTSGQTIFL